MQNFVAFLCEMSDLFLINMRFFDYLYYRVCKAYSSTIDSSPEFASVSVISTMQCFIVLTCFMILALIKKNKSVLNLPIVIVIFLFF